MKRTLGASLLLAALVCLPSWAQSTNQSETTLRINSRAVLLDIVITGRDGKPVQGLPRDAFSITEDNKPQTIQFFEEHKAAEQTAPKEMPKLPENTFTNFSPFPQPPAVNVLLLDSLNTRMENQSFVHSQALKFLKSSKPGDRMAIFTMGLGLHFIQGFNDDPSVLVAALESRKNNWVESSVLLKDQAEQNSQTQLVNMMNEPVGGGGLAVPTTSASAGMISSLVSFMNTTDQAQSADRIWLTLANLQKLATFLEGFPGRKNIIWFAQDLPSSFITTTTADGSVTFDTNNPGLDKEMRKTMASLTAARVAIYPVSPEGAAVYSVYNAETNLAHAGSSAPQMMDAFKNSRTSDAVVRNSNQIAGQMLAEQSGGRAFANTNGLAKVMQTVAGDSADFYTVSYSPSNTKMDGRYRSIKVNVKGDYHLSYRRGYFALDRDLPGASLVTRDAELRKLEERSGGQLDPLLPFMSLGMPQSQQILYKAKIQQLAPSGNGADPDKNKTHYAIDFAVDLNDLKFKIDAAGLHDDELNISMIAYDRYGNIVARKDHRIQLNVKPDVWQIFQQDGVQLHGEIVVPQNGNYWLRTGIYDQATHKAGTMEIPLSAVKVTQASRAVPRD